MPPRERLRSKLRRRAEFLVQTGAARRPMTPAEIEHFLTCVENNSPNEFGLVRLSELALDDFLDVERRGYAWDAVRDVGLEGPQTLLAYAAWLGRAWIVRALLRAGADPSARPKNRTPGVNTTPRGHLPNPSPRLPRDVRREPPPSRDTPGHSAETPPSETPRTLGDLTRVMMQQYPESATWLTIAMVHARASAKPRMRENRRDDDFAAACVSCAARAIVAPVAFAPCCHVACEACAWRHVVDHHGEMGCPRCDAEAQMPHDPTRARRARDASLARWRRLPPDAKAAADAVSASTTVPKASEPLAASTTVPKASETSNDPRAEGVETTKPSPLRRECEMVGGRPAAAPDRWLAPGIVRVRGSRKTFVPEPPGRAARRRVVKLTTRRERDEALRTAAALGDVPTVRALVAAGADVDAADECGLGPLAVAAWRGRAATVRELLRAGADHAAVAPGGATAWSAARANGHDAVLRELRRAGMEPEAFEEIEALEKSGMEGGENPCLSPSSGLLSRSTSLSSRDLAPRTTRLPVPASVLADVPSGVGAMYVDDGLPEPFLAAAEELMAAVHAAGPRSACSDASRSRFADIDGWVREGLARAIERGIDADGGFRTGDRPTPRARAVVLPRMRFLRYPEPGGRLAPHVDLRKCDEETGGRSTHTFCLYLATCERGGETVLLDRVRDPTDPMSDRVGVTAFGGEAGGRGVCAPRRGRVLVFPHDCPHAGRPVVDVPKLLLRGECYVEWEEEEDGSEMETVPRGEGGGGG